MLRDTGCIPIDLLTQYATGSLTATTTGIVSRHVSGCASCRQDIHALQPLKAALPAWPVDVIRPAKGLWDRLARRIASEAQTAPLPPACTEEEPIWREVAPGIFCKLLSASEPDDRVSMLVRLAPGVEYPPHQHAGPEELFLLEGELWIDGRKLVAGDYNLARAGSSDSRVRSQTGCTCVLITSARDRLTVPASS